MEIKKSTINWTIFVIVVSAIMFFMVGGSPTGNAVSGDSQEIIISMKNWRYSPDTIRVKAGTTVSLGLDRSVQGCFRDLILPEMGLKKYLASPNDRLVFTAPMKKGRYTFACSMYMGTGTIIVE